MSGAHTKRVRAEKTSWRRKSRTRLLSHSAEVQVTVAILFGDVVVVDHALDAALGSRRRAPNWSASASSVFVQFQPRFCEFELLRESLPLICCRSLQEFRDAGYAGTISATLFFAFDIRSRMARISGVDGTGCDVASRNAAANSMSTS